MHKIEETKSLLFDVVVYPALRVYWAGREVLWIVGDGMQFISRIFSSIFFRPKKIVLKITRSPHLTTQLEGD